MKTEIKTFLVLVPFFVVMFLIYGFATGWSEWVGLIALPLTAAFAAWIAGYFFLAARSTDPRPEDNLDGEISDTSGDYGHFSPYSWWPLWLGLAVSIASMSLAFHIWMTAIAAPFLVLAIIGWTFEYFRGERAV